LSEADFLQTSKLGVEAYHATAAIVDLLTTAPLTPEEVFPQVNYQDLLMLHVRSRACCPAVRTPSALMETLQV